MGLVRNVWRRWSFLMYKAEIPQIQSLRKNHRTSGMQQTMILSPKNQNTEIKSRNSEKPKQETTEIINALGATNELVSHIGLAKEFACDSAVEHPYVDKLKRVQMILFDISHAISKSSNGKMQNFETKHTNDLEEWNLEYANGLAPPEDYIIPGGGKACASLHITRAICKRAEQSVIPLVQNGTLDAEAQIYLNKLSDFLLTISRVASKCDQRTENIYIPRASVLEGN